MTPRSPMGRFSLGAIRADTTLFSANDEHNFQHLSIVYGVSMTFMTNLTIRPKGGGSLVGVISISEPLELPFCGNNVITNYQYLSVIFRVVDDTESI